jgi:hypothetical protein
MVTSRRRDSNSHWWTIGSLGIPFLQNQNLIDFCSRPCVYRGHAVWNSTRESVKPEKFTTKITRSACFTPHQRPFARKCSGPRYIQFHLFIRQEHQSKRSYVSPWLFPLPHLSGQRRGIAGIMAIQNSAEVRCKAN